MPRFMDYHDDLKLPQEAIDQIAEGTRDGATDAFGVRQVELYHNPDGKVYCLLEGPDEEAIRQHHAALGVPCGDVHEVSSLLRSGDVAGMGPLLTESHQSLRDDFEVSWPQADVAVDAATAAGALGARMMGGGFGGSVIILVPAGRSASIVAAVGAEYDRRNWPPPALVPASAEAGAYLMA